MTSDEAREQRREGQIQHQQPQSLHDDAESGTNHGESSAEKPRERDYCHARYDDPNVEARREPRQSIEPRGAQDRPQMAILAKHPSRP